jgi:hypothetical protein
MVRPSDLAIGAPDEADALRRAERLFDTASQSSLDLTGLDPLGIPVATLAARPRPLRGPARTGSLSIGQGIEGPIPVAAPTSWARGFELGLGLDTDVGRELAHRRHVRRDRIPRSRADGE